MESPIVQISVAVTGALISAFAILQRFSDAAWLPVDVRTNQVNSSSGSAPGGCAVGCSPG